MTKTLFATVLLTGLFTIQALSQDRSWRIENLESSVLTEIKSQVGNDTVSRKAEKGSIVQIKGVFSPPTGTATLKLSEIKLSGKSSDSGVSTSWSFEPIGIGMTAANLCAYTFPDSIVKGKQVQSLTQGGELGIGREKEGDEVTLSVAQATPLCLAFPVPATPQSEMRLQFAGSEIVVPAAVSK